MRKKNKLRIILMWMLSLTLILSVNFSVFASNQNITQSDIKISSLHDEEGLSLNATSLSTDSVNLHNRKNASSLASREQEVVGEFTYHTNYLYVDGKLRYGFVIDSMIGEKPKVLTVHFTLRHGSNIKQVTANTNLGTVNFKSSEIRKGQVKYVTTAANTMFWKLNTSFNAVMADGTSNPGANGQITPILTNKKGQIFPQYVDPVSKKDAESTISTTWKKLAKSPTWNGRSKYIKQYEEKYGKQPSSFWSSVQIHHIRPRQYGGALNDFNNLMPVKTESHRAITSWFRNY